MRREGNYIAVASSILLALLLALHPVEASTTSDPLLQLVAGARVRVSTGALSFEPIGGLDVKALRGEIERRCAVAASAARLETVARAEPVLSVTLDHGWPKEQRGIVAVLVRVQLTIPAVPRDLPDLEGQSRGRSIVVWEDDRLELVDPPQAGSEILGLLDKMLTRLVEDRTHADQ